VAVQVQLVNGPRTKFWRRAIEALVEVTPLPVGTTQAEPLPAVQSTVSRGGEWWLVLSVGVDYRVVLLDPRSQAVRRVVELTLRVAASEPASNAAADERNVVERRRSVLQRMTQAVIPSTLTATDTSAAAPTPRPDRVTQSQVEEIVLQAASTSPTRAETEAAATSEGGTGGASQDTGTKRGLAVAWAFDGRHRADSTQPSELKLQLTQMMANGHVRPISNDTMHELQNRSVPVVETPCVAVPRPLVEASTGGSSPTEVAPGACKAVTAQKVSQVTPVIPTGVVALGCGHALHEECIRRWLERSARCPLCREAVRGRRQVLQGIL